MTPDALVGARCARHAGTQAVDVCSRCGAFVCAACEELSPTDQVFCEACYPLVKPREPTARSYVAWVLLGLAELLVAGGVFWSPLFSMLGLPVGVAATVLVVLDARARVATPAWVKALVVFWWLANAALLAFFISLVMKAG